MSNVAAFVEGQSGRDARVSDFFEIRCNQEPTNAMGSRFLAKMGRPVVIVLITFTCKI